MARAGSSRSPERRRPITVQLEPVARLVSALGMGPAVLDVVEAVGMENPGRTPQVRAISLVDAEILRAGPLVRHFELLDEAMHHLAVVAAPFRPLTSQTAGLW